MALKGRGPQNEAERAEHVPASLVYGPVRSRRFGRSLGLSFTVPGQVGCRWRCPYCQLSHLPRRAHGGFPPAAQILAEFQAALATAGDCDVVCLAGSGEPSEHPDFPALVRELGDLCRARGLRTVMLTNGDGLVDPQHIEAATGLDEVWLKWDPGPREGAWRSLGVGEVARRRELARRLKPLRIQTLLYLGPGRAPGNCTDEARQQWLEELRPLHPLELQLTTIDRRSGRIEARPLPAPALEAWADQARAGLLSCRVAVFP